VTETRLSASRHNGWVASDGMRNGTPDGTPFSSSFFGSSTMFGSVNDVTAGDITTTGRAASPFWRRASAASPGGPPAGLSRQPADPGHAEPVPHGRRVAQRHQLGRQAVEYSADVNGGDASHTGVGRIAHRF
jgi:hypothetical protein